MTPQIPPEPALVRAIRQFKDALLADEQAQVQQMAARWLQVERALDARIQALLLSIAELTANGTQPTQGRILRLERFKELLRQTQDELAGYGVYAEQTITTQQEQYGNRGLGDAYIAARLAVADAQGVAIDFNALNIGAVEQMIGNTGDGAPLGNLLREVWPEAAANMAAQLIQATAQGQNPRVTAQRMRDGLSLGLNRALTIARTEQLRVYREATRLQYQESGVIGSYRRLAARDRRTCMACLMADGTEYTLETTFEDHPNGRCTLVPVMKNSARQVTWETGPEWFARQTPDAQREQMGAGYFAAWQSGKFTLDKLITRHTDPVWGASLQVTPLGELI